jgi:hypothetical protein
MHHFSEKGVVNNGVTVECMRLIKLTFGLLTGLTLYRIHFIRDSSSAALIPWILQGNASKCLKKLEVDNLVTLV